MTKDEEMAEEYVRSQGNVNILNLGENTVDLSFLKRGVFLDGLKAGRPKWHKVADGDLPKEGTEVLNDDGVVVVLLKGHWRYVHGGEWEDDACVDHWCEIPQYTEE